MRGFDAEDAAALDWSWHLPASAMPDIADDGADDDLFEAISDSDVAELLQLLDSNACSSEASAFDAELDALLGRDNDFCLDLDDLDDVDVFMCSNASVPIAASSQGHESVAVVPPQQLSDILALPPAALPTRTLEDARKKKTSLQRQKEEIAALRSSVAALEVQLGALKQPTNSARSSGSSTVSRYTSLWQGLAARQMQDRTRAENENAELRSQLKAQANLAKTLERALRKRLVRTVCQTAHVRVCDSGLWWTMQATWVHWVPHTLTSVTTTCVHMNECLARSRCKQKPRARDPRRDQAAIESHAHTLSFVNTITTLSFGSYTIYFRVSLAPVRFDRPEAAHERTRSPLCVCASQSIGSSPVLVLTAAFVLHMMRPAASRTASYATRMDSHSCRIGARAISLSPSRSECRLLSSVHVSDPTLD